MLMMLFTIYEGNWRIRQEALLQECQSANLASQITQLHIMLHAYVSFIILNQKGEPALNIISFHLIALKKGIIIFTFA